MARYIARRLILYIPSLFAASVLIFAIMRILPGDVAMAILGSEDDQNQALVQQQIDSLRAELGLNDPLAVQYGRWAWSLIDGEFGGRSLWDKEPLPSIIGRRLPVTLQLTLYTMLITWTVSIPLGVLAAIYQNRPIDYVIRAVSIAGHAVPNFWVALMLLLALLWWFSWSPPIFYANLWDDPEAHLQQMIWPALILAWAFSATVIRVTRSSMLEVLRQDYIRTARAKGLVDQVVVLRHALRNSLIPVITLGGLEVGALLSGTVILEGIFGLPGVGQGIVLAATTRDYPIIQTLVMLLVATMLTLNLAVDLVYSFVDPRIRYS